MTTENINEIEERIQIIEVIEQFVPLKKKGANFSACCPFHDEKTASFSVSESKGIFTCFGCGAKGDSIEFLMKHESFTYIEALEFLAKQYSIEIQKKPLSEAETKAQQEKESLYIIHNYANTFYQNNLKESKEGSSYFEQRRFSKAITQKFELGYSLNEWATLEAAALNSGNSKEILEKSGLVIYKDAKHYDRFRGRVMFPIHNTLGRVCGFGARIINVEPFRATAQAKYLNSPSSEIYNKSSELYGLFQGKGKIKQEDVCYLVEGYTDVLSLHQIGISNVVASSGTSLTEAQIQKLKRYTKNITILFDGDKAGVKAALRGIELILSAGLNPKIVQLPKGKDPDTYAQELGEKEFKAFLKGKTTDFIHYKAKVLLSEAENEPSKKAEVIKDIVSSILKVQDKIQRELYFQSCSKMLDIDIDILRNEKPTTKATPSQPTEKKNSDKKEQTKVVLGGSLVAKLEKSAKGKKAICEHLIITQSHATTKGNINQINDFLLSNTDIISVPKLKNIYDENIKDKLQTDILEVVVRLKVKRITLLLPSDTFVIQWEKGKNLDIKPRFFKNAIWEFKEALQTLLNDKETALEEIFFAHILTLFNDPNKTDLLGLVKNNQEKPKNLKADLKELHSYTNRFFNAKNITKSTEKELEKFFGLNNREHFYSIYKKYIEEKEFVFGSYSYQWDKEERAVVTLQHKDLPRFFLIKAKYMKSTLTPLQNESGEIIPTLDMYSYSSSLIDFKYGKDFRAKIPEYGGFTFLPGHGEKFQRVVNMKMGETQEALLNIYEPLQWIEKKGAFPNTIHFLKHIFQGKGTLDKHIEGDYFTMGLDYLTLMYTNPTQKLPLILLLSEAQQTGKTSFSTFFTMIYGNNSVNLSLNDFTGTFNGVHAKKYVVAIDEGKVEEKSATKNQLKYLLTSDNITINEKNQPIYFIPNVKKVLFFSNEEKTAIRMEAEDNRFWCIKVPKIPEGKKDAHLLSKIRKEIPAFLHFLANREVFHKGGEDRLYFHEDIIRGKKGESHFWKMVEAARPIHEVEIDNFIKGLFVDYRIKQLRIDVKHIKEGIKEAIKYAISDQQVKEYLMEGKGYELQRKSTLRIPNAVTEEKINGKYQIEFTRKKDGKYPQGRYFEFLPKDWLNEKELEEHSKGFDALVFEDYDPLKDIITEENLKENFYQFIGNIRAETTLKTDYICNLFCEERNTDLLTLTNIKNLVIIYQEEAKNCNYQQDVFKWVLKVSEDFSAIKFETRTLLNT